MDTAAVVNLPPELQEGKKAIEAIRGAGIPVRSAYWAYFNEAQEYRLVVPTDRVQSVGLRSVYLAIQRAFSQKGIKIPLRQITLVRPDEPLGVLGLNAVRLAAPFGGGGSLVEAFNVKVDTRYIYA